MNKKLRVVDFIAHYLHQEGVKVVFMLSGTGSVYIDDAFAVQEGIRYICARHEAAATIMAMSSAKILNEIGVVIATTGPGGSNAIGGVVEAWVDSAPVLVISGQVATNQISPGVRSFGVQGFNIIENVSKITKYAAQITDPQSTKMHLQKAIHCATTGRPGPVWLDIPMDIQAAEVDLASMPDYIPPAATDDKSNSEAKKIYNALYESQRPLVVFGQGIRQSNAINLLINFLEDIKLPAIATRMGIDILGDKNPYYFGLGGVRGTVAAAKIMKSADFVLAIGTSFTHAFAGAEGEYFSKDARVAMVNIDHSEFSKPGVSVDMSLKMDVSQFLRNFSNIQIDFKNQNCHVDWLTKCKNILQENKVIKETMKSDPINSYYFVDCLNRCMTKNQILISDAGSANYICSQGAQLKFGQREITSGAFYSMGLSLPLAIGASASNPEVQVVAVTGDGSIELNIQELRTMGQNNLNIKLFVINNGGYASIRKSQDAMAGGRYTDDINVLNFSKIADAFEIDFKFISKSADLEHEIASILEIEGPCLIELLCDPNQEILNPFQISAT